MVPEHPSRSSTVPHSAPLLPTPPLLGGFILFYILLDFFFFFTEILPEDCMGIFFPMERHFPRLKNNCFSWGPS